MNAKPKQARARPLRGYILALSAAIVLPVFILVGALTWKWVEAEQARIRASVGDVAQDAIGQIDRYVGGQIAMLQALASSPAIDLGDFTFMDSQMRELARINETMMVLRDREGNRFVDTRYDRGQELPRIPLTDGELRVLSSRAAYVSDLFVTDAGSATPVARVSVPVIRDGEVRYVIAARLPQAKLNAILSGSGIGPPYLGAVTDRTGRIIAADDGAGQVGSIRLGRAVGDTVSGQWIGTDPDGVERHTSYRRSPLSGWVVGVSVDASYLNAPLVDSLWAMGLLGTGLSLTIGLASSLIAHRIIDAQRQVHSAAIAVGLGETIAAPRTAVRETNLIGDALAEASMRLRDQAAALVAANRDLEAHVESRTRELSKQAELIQVTLDTMAQGLMMIDADGRVAICNRRALEILDLPLAFVAESPRFADVAQYQIDRGDFGPSDKPLWSVPGHSGLIPHLETYERERTDGSVLEVRTMPLADGGAVRTYTDITARKSAERQAIHMARHDPLTLLPNRTLLLDRLGQELAQPAQSPFALLMVDLDRFKSVNDKHGHPTGDALLKLVTARIVAIVDPQDLVVRLGGDEFAILHFAATLPEDASRLAVRIIETIQEPFSPNGQEVRIGASIGVAIAPHDGQDVEGILKSADLALYRAKSEGGCIHRCYEAAMDAAAQARLALELDLRHAIENGEIELHYQPVIGFADGEVVGFEALARWNHPVRGAVGPNVFIQIAEETRLIIPLGNWALQQACQEATGWPAPTRVLINISALQIEDPAFVSSVVAAIARSGLAPGRVQLEITESVLIRESSGVMQALQSLRDFGVTVALDDFGTGYSSLNYLRQFPLDTVKIDRSFVKCFDDPRSAAIMSAITSLALGFGMSVTAEGVETHEQLDFVRSIGCTDVQGYLFGKPMPAAQAASFARQPPTTPSVRAA